MKLSEVITTHHIQVYLEERIETAREKFGTAVFNPVHNRSANDREKSFAGIRNYILQDLIEAGKYNTEVSRRTSKLSIKDFPHITNSDAEDAGIWIRMLRKKGILGAVKAVNRLWKFMMPREDRKYCDEFYNVQGQLKMFQNARHRTNAMFINQFSLDFKRIMAYGERLSVGQDRVSSEVVLTYGSNPINHLGYPEIHISESPDKRDIVFTVRARERGERCRRFARAVDHLNYVLHEMAAVDSLHWIINSSKSATVTVRLVNQEPRVTHISGNIAIDSPVALYPAKVAVQNPLEISLKTIEQQLETVLATQKKVEAEYAEAATQRSNLTRQVNVLTLSRDQLKNALYQMAK